MKKTFQALGNICICILGILLHLWSALALHYCVVVSWSVYIAYLYLLLIIVFTFSSKKKLKAFKLSYIAFFIVCVWFISIKPPTTGAYPENLTMPYAEFKDDSVTIHNVRNCDYRTVEDFDVNYESRTYNLKKLETLDLFMNFWDMENIAHAFLSFGFSDGEYLVVSIETRPEVGKEFGMLNGFFKQYELIYIWGDEKDLVRLRTNYKEEDVYLYRIAFKPDQIQTLFLSMVERTNNLYETPEFYNTLVQSCTNTIGDHIKKTGIYPLPFWKRRLLSGKVSQLAYDEKMLDQRLPFKELRKAANINERAKAANKDKDFSQKIRTHLFLN